MSQNGFLELLRPYGTPELVLLNFGMGVVCVALCAWMCALKLRGRGGGRGGGGSSTPESKGKQKKTKGGPVTLRIVNVTDVYMLDNFPSLRTLIKEQTLGNPNGPTVSMLTGDFLAPYLLSSLDFGKGMIKMLNQTPIDYLIWGNHEHDLPHRHVVERAKEYKGTWINTNMQGHEAMPYQVPTATITCSSRDGAHTRRVGLISLLTDQPGLYRPNAFNGAKIEDPWKTATVYKKKLEAGPNGVDLVVPLCHLYEPQDEKTCQEFDFPVVISGHDHHTVDRMISGSRLVKAGSDGHKAAIIDITWADAESTKPDAIDVKLVTVKDWAADPALQKEADKCLSVLDSLRHTQLVCVPNKFEPLNSIGVRGAVTTAGQFLSTMYRDAFNHDLSTPYCDLCLMPGGNIRGGKLYKKGEFFSLEALKSEVHPKMDIVIVQMPGRVIFESVKTSHSRGHHPYYLHYDDGVTVNASHEVTRVNGVPLDLDKLYNVAYPPGEIRAENGPKALREYFEANPPNPRHLSSTSRGGQEFLLQYWAQQVWAAVWERLDSNHDGTVDRAEFMRLDSDGDGDVDADELMKFMHDELGFEMVSGETSFASFVLRAGGDHDHDGNLTWDEFKRAADLDSDLEHKAVMTREF
jgi:2',3'-cyclic-nucleotide 2'-phosphodiesterase (5'-nucleotidase family)